MKKPILMLTIFCLTIGTKAQNQFKKTGDAFLDGKSLNIKAPVTSGGWARGVFHFDSVNTRVGGYGMLGSGATAINYLYMAHGSDPWSSGLGLFIKPNGYMGVGVTDPQELLHINGNVRGNAEGGALRINTITGYIDIGAQNSSWAHIYTDRPKFIFNKDVYTTTGVFSSYDSTDLNLKTNATTRLTINNSTGNVGVGTTTPAEKLEVKGTVKSSRLLVKSDVSGVLLDVDGPKSAKFEYSANDIDWSGLLLKDQLGKIRVNFSMRSDRGSDSFFELNDKNQASAIKFAEGTSFGTFMHMPKANSRIVIGSWGNYLFEEGHKLVVKDGSAMIEGNILTNSKIGIGTTAPAGKLHINTTNTNGNYNTIFDGNSLAFENGGQSSYIRKLDIGKLFFSIGATSNYVMSLSNNGNIGIGTGTANTDEKLTVKGKIHTQEVRVDLLGAVAPDYVFEKYYQGASKLNPNYKMPTLKEVETFTKANHHLPEIPSAHEMQDYGMELKAMNLKLLQKIEELTLYAIGQEKRLNAQNDDIKSLKKENEVLKSVQQRLTEIEEQLNNKN